VSGPLDHLRAVLDDRQKRIDDQREELDRIEQRLAEIEGDLGAERAPDRPSPKPPIAALDLCEVCRNPLPPKTHHGGQPRRYCGPKCRQRGSVKVRVKDLGLRCAIRPRTAKRGSSV
jgi:hypothetical protein